MIISPPPLVYHASVRLGRKHIQLLLQDGQKSLLLDLVAHERQSGFAILGFVVGLDIHINRNRFRRTLAFARGDGQPRFGRLGDTYEPVVVGRDLDLLSLGLVRELQLAGAELIGPFDGHRRLHIVRIVVVTCDESEHRYGHEQVKKESSFFHRQFSFNSLMALFRFDSSTIYHSGTKIKDLFFIAQTLTAEFYGSKNDGMACLRTKR